MARRRSSLFVDPAARLRSATLCDLVRTEDNGKKILVGCYTGGVTFRRKPTIFIARIYGGFEFLKPGIFQLDYRVTGPGIVGEGALGTTSADEPAGVGEFDAPFQCLIEEEAELSLEWRVGDEPWQPKVTWFLNFDEETKTLSPEEADAVRARYWGAEWPLHREARADTPSPAG